MQRGRHLHCGGWSLLEMALLFVLASTFVSGGFALVQYSWTVRSLDDIVDRNIYDSAAKPFFLGSTDGHVTITVKSIELNGLVRDVADRVFDALNQSLSAAPAGARTPIFVEAVYAEAEIDPQSGRASGLRRAPFSFQAARGNRGLPAAAGAETLLETEVSSRADHSTFALPGLGSNASMYAVPTGAYAGTVSRGDRFLPATVILGARAAVSLENTFTGNVLGLLGINPVVYSQKIVNLRGELG